jgi:formamidopyrimidine-DNA glycosylase
MPEVETIVRDLRGPLVGRRIVDGTLLRPGMVRLEPEAFMSRVVGRRVEKVERRGKYIRIGLEGGIWLLVHLGMSGRLSLALASSEMAKHTHATWRLEGGLELRYSDPRRFGRLGAGTEAEIGQMMPRLGPEAIGEFSLHERLKGKQASIKAVLLDQHVLAGVGNIYADEALWRARVRPGKPAGDLNRPQAARLQKSLKEVLMEAVVNRGSSIEGYRDAWGLKGQQQEHLAVYGRASQPCWRCGRPLRMQRLGGRSSTWCTHCQR